MGFPVRLSPSGPPVIAGGTPGYFWTVDADGSTVALVPPPELGGVTSFNERTGNVTPQEGDYDADVIDYAPSVASNWGPIPPTTTQAALDALAAVSNLEQHAAGALGAAATITFTTPAITPKRSGSYLVLAYICGTASGATTETLELLADATIIAVGRAGTGNSNEFSGALFAPALLDHSTTHTFTVRATAAAGTNSSASGEVRIVTLEIGG